MGMCLGVGGRSMCVSGFVWGCFVVVVVVDLFGFFFLFFFMFCSVYFLFVRFVCFLGGLVSFFVCLFVCS